MFQTLLAELHRLRFSFPGSAWERTAPEALPRFAKHKQPMSTQLNRLFLFLLLGCSVSIAYAQDSGLESHRMVDGLWGFQTPTSYKILPRPATHSNKNQPHTNVFSANTTHSQPIQPYAYGWFGTKPSPQWSRQFGYQKAYTQWTFK